MDTSRFPIAELESCLRATSAREMAGLLKVSSRTVVRYRRRGLSVVQADRAAVAVGFHPAEVWPNWW